MKPRTVPLEDVPVDTDLVLSPLESADARPCYEACQDPVINAWIPLPKPYTLEIASAWCGGGAEDYRLQGLGAQFGIRRLGRFCGCMALKAPNWREGVIEISYWVAPGARRMGVASRSVPALANHAFALGFDRVEIRVAPGNVASVRVAEKSGFQYEGTLRSAGVLHSGRTDLMLFSLLMSDVFN
jgi:RimJ/RimL family protein N-acetyltransferase